MNPSVCRRAVAAARCVILLLVFSLAAFMAPLHAGEDLAADGISRDEAVTLVRQRTKGKVIRVDRNADGATVFYRIRVLTPNGRLREYQVDALTGAIR